MYKIVTIDIGEKGLTRNYVCAAIHRDNARSRACEIIKRALPEKQFELRFRNRDSYLVVSNGVVIGKIIISEVLQGVRRET